VPGASELVTVDGDAVTLAVHVQPRAGRTAIVGRHGDALKMRVAAPPVDDRANAAAAELIVEVLGVAKGDVELVSGARSRLKRFRVKGVERETVIEVLERVLDEAKAPPGPHQRRAR
jgi:uncharacterized protein (TIGR00251 family)